MSISRIDHIAIAVTSIKEASEFYTKALGLSIAKIEEMPERGIKTAFIQVGETMIELMEPLNTNSEISKFLEKRGPGLHHVAFRSDDMTSDSQKLKNHHVKLIYSEARPGAHKSQVNFVHPSCTSGVLVELVSY